MTGARALLVQGQEEGRARSPDFFSVLLGIHLIVRGGEFVDGNVIFVLLNLIVRLFAVMYHFSEANEF